MSNTSALSPLVDVLIGLIVAGVVAPFTMALPERWQGTGTLWTLAVLCVGGVFLIRYLLARLDKAGH